MIGNKKDCVEPPCLLASFVYFVVTCPRRYFSIIEWCLPVLFIDWCLPGSWVSGCCVTITWFTCSDSSNVLILL